MPPSFRFNSTRDDDYPFSILITYQTPQEFRSGLANTLQREVLHVNKSLLVLEQALALFGAKGMEKHYEREESRRWRAWYDLTRGRMLAQSVRNIEYLYACQLLVNNANFLAPETNHVVFEPSTRLLSNRTDVLARVNEAQRLLKRCMSENPDTPWAALAQWEMDIAPGLGIRQIVVPPPIPGPPAPPRAPVPPLPNF